MNRRNLLSSSALAPVFALTAAGCSILTPANVATVEKVIAQIQAVMPYVSGIANVLGVVVPGAVSVIATVEAGLSTAASVFNSVTSSMTTAAAQPLVGKIATAIEGAVTATETIAASLPAKAQFVVSGLLSQARTVISDLNAFVNPAVVSASPVPPTLPTMLFIRNVR